VNVYVVVLVLLMAGDQVPVTPLFEVVGNVKLPPLHIAATCVNAVVVVAFTTTVMLAFTAHCPAAGVNVYVVVAALLMAGDQVPVMLLLDVVGKLNEAPLQIGATCVNVGTTPGAFTVTVMVAVVTQLTDEGVKVYVVVVVLLIAGVHVPLMPLVDVDGNVKVPPLQMAETCVNVGTVGANPVPTTATFIVLAPPPVTGMFPL